MATVEYRVVEPVVVTRNFVAREAERVGALEPGEVVQVLETRELRQEGVAPMLRLRTARGWVSTATGKGAEVVLEPTGFVGGARWWWPTADAGQ